MLDGDLNPTGIPDATIENGIVALVGAPDGIYCFEVSDANGCTGTFCDTLGTISGIQNPSRSAFSIYPNPTSTVAQLMLPADWRVQLVVIRDAAGRWVETIAAPQKAQRIEVGSLLPGTYLVEVKHAEGSAFQRMVVQR